MTSRQGLGVGGGTVRSKATLDPFPVSCFLFIVDFTIVTLVRTCFIFDNEASVSGVAHFTNSCSFFGGNSHMDLMLASLRGDRF